MADITAIILTRNEEKLIGGCIDQLKKVAKRIVVIDSFSDDNTMNILNEKEVEVYQHDFFNYSKQYKYGVEIAKPKTKWIFRIDADEYLTDESANEIERLCNENMNTDVTGIVIRFRNVFMGREMLHGGHYPWKKLSIYKTGFGDIEDRHMDEHIVLSEGKTIETKNDCVHHAFKSLSFLTNKYNWYSTREAMDYFEDKKVNITNASFKTRIKMNVYYKLPIGIRSYLFYVYRYYIRLGFLDGKEGKIYAFLQAYWYRFLVDAKIYEHEKLGEKFEPTGKLK